MRNGIFKGEALKAVGRHSYIPNPSDKEKNPLTQKIEELVKQILELRKKDSMNRISTGDSEFQEKKIDELVEKLYGV